MIENNLSPIAKSVMRLYDNSQMSKDGLYNAVAIGLITPDDYEFICGEPFEQLVETTEPTENIKEVTEEEQMMIEGLQLY